MVGGMGLADSATNLCYLINILHCLENAFVICRLCMYIWLLGVFSLDFPRISLKPAGGLAEVPTPSVPSSQYCPLCLQVLATLLQF